MTDPVLSLDNVCLSFGERRFFRRKVRAVLKNVSLQLFPGETLGVVGRNGSGKSSLLRLMAGVYQPDSGSIDCYQTSISYLSLSLGFDRFLSGRDNALICGMFLGKSRQEVLDRLDDIIAFSELEDFIDQPIRNYSSGMRARLGFSVAITLETDLLLIDEVLGVGDANFRAKAIDAMTRKIVGNQTVVFVSHSDHQVKALCDRAIWIEKGHVRQAGGTDRVLEAYNEFLSINPQLNV